MEAMESTEAAPLSAAISATMIWPAPTGPSAAPPSAAIPASTPSSSPTSSPTTSDDQFE